MHDSVCIDVESDFDLRHTARCGRKVDELELAERLVELRHFALALEHVDLNRRLIVFRSGEHLGTTSRDGGVALDELGHDRTLGFNTERKRCDVEKENVLDLALEHASLNGSADGDDLVGIHALMRIVARHFLDEIDNGRHTR